MSVYDTIAHVLHLLKDGKDKGRAIIWQTRGVNKILFFGEIKCFKFSQNTKEFSKKMKNFLRKKKSIQTKFPSTLKTKL